MDSSGVITQVQRDEEPLATFPPPPAVTTKGAKPRKGGLLHSLLCCWRRRTESGRLRGVGGNDQADQVDQGVAHNHLVQGGLHVANATGNSAATQLSTGQHDGANKFQEEPTRENLGGVGSPVGVPIASRSSWATSAASSCVLVENRLSLLPPLRASDQGKICLVIDLDETLVHSSFKPVNNPDFVVPVEIEGSVHQVYVLKRPFVDEFLERVGALYECILFTASLSKYADPVADLLDKWSVFRGRLFRESCAFYRGNYVKDLNRLGREVHRVVIIDNSPASYMFHPDNAVPVGSWFDDMSDTELRDLIPFFERLARAPPQDVYSLLRQQQQQPQIGGLSQGGTVHSTAVTSITTTTTTMTMSKATSNNGQTATPYS